MKNCNNEPQNRTTRRILLIACATALALACTVSLPQPAYAQRVKQPPVPPNIQVTEGVPFLEGHATGSQNYVCLPSSSSASGFAYSLFTPEATLFNDDADQIITHFFSLNPDEQGTPIRATWEASRDTSTVWAATVDNGTATNATDPDFVAPGAIAWLKLKVVGRRAGPNGGDKLTETTFIQRLNTHGGSAPSTGCSGPADVGNRAFVPYRADYFFYHAPDRE